MKKIQYKNIETEIPNNTYISKIESIVGKVKNVTFEVSLENIKIYEFKDTLLAVLQIKDTTGVMSALMVANRNPETKQQVASLHLENFYRIRGTVTDDIECIYEMLENTISIDTFYDKVLLVRAIASI